VAAVVSDIGRSRVGTIITAQCFRPKATKGVKQWPDKDLNDLFLDGLNDIYHAEKQIFKSLPKMAKAASSEERHAAFQKHQDKTEGK
jgi:hypothetical protein